MGRATCGWSWHGSWPGHVVTNIIMAIMRGAPPIHPRATYMGKVGSHVPRKSGLNWFMPALQKSSVGSSCGTHGDDFQKVWPCCSTKNWWWRAEG